MILEAGALGTADVNHGGLRGSGDLYFCVPLLTRLRDGHLWCLSSILRHFGVSGIVISGTFTGEVVFWRSDVSSRRNTSF